MTIQPFLKVDPSLPIKLTEIDRTVTVNDALRGITAAQTGSRQGGELEDRTAYGRFPSGSDIWVSMIASVGSIARP
ncbi:hypothetical protein FHR83_008762 [Actinoplanes campanulatus]|uniref:Uncharacterized protein n=1 Tax=Actinoplanes campanulatus TaxID=113559 RepID=A0A7W5FJR8_9ACTN|nr:hypothetical protein [Actinoplanes campanulatus]MBB3101034.1 hypothetical protein [Actinoplanes campanulatus]